MAKSSVSKARQALVELLGSQAVDLIQKVGRLVLTTSRDARIQEPGVRGEIGIDAIASYARLSGEPLLASVLADQRSEFLRVMQPFNAPSGASSTLTLKKTSSGTGPMLDMAQWRMIFLDFKNPGKWRVQSFDASGLSETAIFDSQLEAVSEAERMGFSVRDDLALQRIQGGARFQRGIFANHLMRKVADLRLSSIEADRLIAQYDGAQAALESIAQAGAQAFIASSGEAIYLLCDRIEEGSEQAVFLHEIFHRYAKVFIDKDSVSALVKRMSSWKEEQVGSIQRMVYERAFQRAAAASGNDRLLFEEEILAYGVEEAVSLGVRPSAKALEGSPEKWLDAVSKTLSQALAAMSLGDRQSSLNHIAHHVQDAQQLVDLTYAFAQLESPERVGEIMQRMSPQEQVQLRAIMARCAQAPWYSQLQSAVQAHSQEKMPAQDWARWIRAQTKNGVKASEIEWSSVCDWLSLKNRSVTKSEVLQYLDSNGVKLQEIVLQGPAEFDEFKVVDLYGNVAGEYLNEDEARDAAKDWYDDDLGIQYSVEKSARPNPDSPRYTDYTVPGGAKNREILLTLPMSPAQLAWRDAISLSMWGKSFDSLSITQEGDEREAVIKANASAAYHSSHWDGVENVLAHIRVNDRETRSYTPDQALAIEKRILDSMGRDDITASDLGSGAPLAAMRKGVITQREAAQYSHFRNFDNGLKGGVEKILFVEEIQSDYAKDASRRGVARSAEGSSRIVAKGLLAPASIGVPDAPFIQSTSAWLSLALKRLVKLAVDEGYDKVAFISGEQSVKRFNLAKKVAHIEYRVSAQLDSTPVRRADLSQEAINKAREDQSVVTYDVRARNFDFEDVWKGDGVSLKEIEKRFGKSVCENIRLTADSQWEIAAEDDMQTGGEGLRTFYDKVVPTVLKDVFRRLGSGSMEEFRIEKSELKKLRDGRFFVEIDGERHVFSKEKSAAEYLRKFSQPEMVQPGFCVTPQMAQAAHFGLPQFSLELVQTVASYAEQGEQRPFSAADELEAQRQCAKIVAQYIGTDQWLKAPDGSDTKLSQAQWVLVRTPNFKRWFGDWETDPSNASLAVDGQTREPCVMYHGTQVAGFSEFEPHKSARGRTPAIFFTSSPDVARSYAGTDDEAEIFSVELDEDGYAIEQDTERGIYPVFLNIRNPHYDDFEGANWDGTRSGQWMVVQGSQDDDEEDEDFMDEPQDIIDSPSGRRYFSHDERHLADALASAHEGAKVMAAQDRYTTTNGVVQEAKRYLSDGAMIYDVVDEGKFGYGGEVSNVFAVFDARQVKSATLNVGTFNPKDSDIRYSLAPGLLPEFNESNTPNQKPYPGEPRTASAAQKRQFKAKSHPSDLHLEEEQGGVHHVRPVG
jgi:ADP-Ribosyltransferase in polyvalent proteins